MYPYKLHGTELKSAKTAKYLGVTIRKDLNGKSHIENVSASNTLEFIKRSIQTKSQKLKETAYNTHVRPQLEHCAPVGIPGSKHLVIKLKESRGHQLDMF